MVVKYLVVMEDYSFMRTKTNKRKSKTKEVKRPRKEKVKK